MNPIAGNARRAKTPEQRTDKIIRCAHMPCQFMRYDKGLNRPGIDIHGVLIDTAHGSAQGFQNFQCRGDICDIWYIFNTANAVGKDYSRKNRDGGIFGSADFHFASQPVAAENAIFFQSAPLPRNINIPIISPNTKKSNLNYFILYAFLPFFREAVIFIQYGWMDLDYTSLGITALWLLR